MQRVVSLKVLSNFRLQVTFDDGTQGIVELAERLFGSVFEPLRDPARFGEAFVDEFGAICWPNGADLAPDALYHQIRAQAPTASRQ